ncbi:MAG: thioredoxin domain-containing protein [Hyphomicrobium sp.]
MRTKRSVLAAGLARLAVMASAARADVAWHPWSTDLFDRARAEQRFVILDLEAVWCHWCHVMEQTTYRDPKVVALLQSKYLAVRVDQDAHPDLSSRYGDWGWPATIVFAPDGTEIVKRRGYIAPAAMASLLQAIIEDPTPGPSVEAETEIVPAEHPLLTRAQRDELAARGLESYDRENGGWGSIHKFIDADSMDWELRQAEAGDASAAKRARQTFDAALLLIDPVGGGLFQYSDAADWKSPHYEKIMAFQSNGLRQYAAAYALWKAPAYRRAADDIARYLLTTLRSPEGAFFTSQDADVDAALPGKAYYALSAAERSALARAPRIDTSIYARENGWAISGLAAYFAATGNEEALSAAETAAHWVVANRRLDGGGFRHGEKDRAGPYLGDTLAMGQAALDLYAATGKREWLRIAGEAGDFIALRFRDPAGGVMTTATPEASVGVLAKPAKPIDEQIAVARFANRLHRHFGRPAYRDLAEHAARFVTSPAILDLPRTLPGVLLVDAELASEPTHITIVGRRDDARSAALHAAARAFPATDKRLDWWDKREGALPNPDVQYPELEQPAAFACTNRICSLPVFEPADLAETVTRMLSTTRSGVH